MVEDELKAPSDQHDANPERRIAGKLLAREKGAKDDAFDQVIMMTMMAHRAPPLI